MHSGRKKYRLYGHAGEYRIMMYMMAAPSRAPNTMDASTIPAMAPTTNVGYKLQFIVHSKSLHLSVLND